MTARRSAALMLVAALSMTPVQARPPSQKCEALAGRIAQSPAAARDRLIVDGEFPAACTVVRILDMVEVFLLPRRLASLAVRRYPQWPPFRKYVGRTLIYLRAVVGL